MVWDSAGCLELKLGNVQVRLVEKWSAREAACSIAAAHAVEREHSNRIEGTGQRDSFSNLVEVIGTKVNEDHLANRWQLNGNFDSIVAVLTTINARYVIDEGKVDRLLDLNNEECVKLTESF